MANDTISAIAVTYQSVKQSFEKLKQTGSTGLDPQLARTIRKDIEDTMELDEYYRIEEETVESRP